MREQGEQGVPRDRAGAGTGVFRCPAESSSPCADCSLTVAHPDVEATRGPMHAGPASRGGGFPHHGRQGPWDHRGQKSEWRRRVCAHRPRRGQTSRPRKPVFGNYLSAQILYYALVASSSFFTAFFSQVQVPAVSCCHSLVLYITCWTVRSTRARARSVQTGGILNTVPCLAHSGPPLPGE